MNRLSAFFKGRDTHLGPFYPEHYLLAVFPNLAQADRAREKLRRAGCGEEDVISSSGEEVVHFAQDHWLQDGLWGFLMRWLSRLLGTEKIKTDAWRLPSPSMFGSTATVEHDVTRPSLIRCANIDPEALA
jgi:hypothetical protein